MLVTLNLLTTTLAEALTSDGNHTSSAAGIESAEKAASSAAGSAAEIIGANDDRCSNTANGQAVVGVST